MDDAHARERDLGMVVLLADATEDETRGRLADLEVARRAFRGDMMAVVDDRTKARLGALDGLAEPLRRVAASVVLPDELSEWLRRHSTLRRTYVVPRGAPLGEELQPPAIPTFADDFVAYCYPKTALSARFYVESPPRIISWFCSRGVLEDLCSLAAPSSWNCASPIRAVNRSGRSVAWLSTRVSDRPRRSGVRDAHAPISRSRSVLAIIPYHACDEWLALSIGSMAAQTRRPDAIVVVDDASPSCPQAIVERYAGVTLVRSPSRVGPYRLVQQVIDDTSFDAYLLQDADDFSAVDRLERLLQEGELTGAHLIGTQALYFDWESGACGLASTATTVPPPSHETEYSVLHPSSVVTRSLLCRLGGFATGVRFGGDQEFQNRAMHVTTLVNTPWCSYFKIKHHRSLTIDPETGMGSPARIEVQRGLRRRFEDNLAAVGAGAAPDLTPFRTAPSIALRRICGPSVTAAWS